MLFFSFFFRHGAFAGFVGVVGHDDDTRKGAVNERQRIFKMKNDGASTGKYQYTCKLFCGILYVCACAKLHPSSSSI
jgi:hypothetical protein